MKLREWQDKRLKELRNQEFPRSKYADKVTVVAYIFPADAQSNDFDYLECSILQTWSVLGKLTTILIANRHFEKLDAFVRLYPEVEVQIEPSLSPGKIETMSADCCARLYKRFSTDYCLIVQDDGFPLQDTLGDFLGKYDYLGAPYVRISWWRNLICHIFGYWMSNGGFSLRSKRICEAAAKYWQKYGKFHPSEMTVDDLYYTKTLPLKHLSYRFKCRIAPNKVAIRFSYDALVAQPIAEVPFGIHRGITFEEMIKKGWV